MGRNHRTQFPRYLNRTPNGTQLGDLEVIRGSRTPRADQRTVTGASKGSKPHALG
jgi:hypothetical protein